MSLLSSKQFSESDFFFLIESFTIFFEKLLPLYPPEIGSTAKSHWIVFKQKLMDKNSTTSQVFAFANSIKISQPSTNIARATESLNNSSTQNIATRVQGSNNSIDIQNKYNSGASGRSDQQQPQQKQYSIQNRGGNLQVDTKKAQNDYRQGQYQVSNNNQYSVPGSATNDSNHHRKISGTYQQSPYLVPTQTSYVAAEKNGNTYTIEKKTTSQQQQYPTFQSKQQNYMGNVDQTRGRKLTQEEYTSPVPAINLNKVNNDSPDDKTSVERVRINNKSRRNSKKIQLKRQKSRTLSMEQLQKAKLDLNNDQNLESHLNEAGKQGYQKRLEELRTKSPGEGVYGYDGTQDNMEVGQEFGDSVIERIKPYDLLKYQQKPNQQQQQNVQQPYSLKPVHQKQPSSEKQPIQYGGNQQQHYGFSSQSGNNNSFGQLTQDQLSQQQQSQQYQTPPNQRIQNLEEQHYSGSNPVPVKYTLSSIKTKQLSFTSSRKDELLDKVRQGIDLIKKHTTTLDLIYDKSFEIDTTKNLSRQNTREFGGYYQPGQPQHNQHQPRERNLEQKKSHLMKKYSVFVKQEQDEKLAEQQKEQEREQQQQQQPKQQQITVQQQQLPPSTTQNHKIDLTNQKYPSSTTSGNDYKKYTPGQNVNIYGNRIEQHNQIYNKIQQVYDTASQFQYGSMPQQKKQGYQQIGGKVFL